jgi:pyruvate-formate lyase-activating enzyme
VSDCFEEVLGLALPEGQVSRPRYASTTERHLTRRGLMWLGQTCNLRCHFCYYLDRIEDPTHPEHAFMPLEKAKAICKTLVDVYGNNSIDVQGGEPTLWPPLPDLIRYCNEIGMKVTVITNGIVLDDMACVRAYGEAGVRDFILSVQGLGPVYDEIVGRKGMWRRQMKGLRNLQEAAIPFRFNTVLSKPVLGQLSQIAELAVRTGAMVVNFLAFNPFDDQRLPGKRSAKNVPYYHELSEPLTAALDLLDAEGVEANVRYVPLCILPERHLKSMYNFQQLSYDLHENEFGGWTWTGEPPQRMAGGELTPPIELGARPPLGPFRKPLRRLISLPGIGPWLEKNRELTLRLWSRAANRIEPPKPVEEVYRTEARTRARDNLGYRFGPACANCDLRLICDGFHGDYAEFHGTDEARPIKLGRVVDDPTQFIKAQRKVLFPSDAEWVGRERP